MEGKGNNIEKAAVYEEFEPFCKWQRKEDRDILEVHLPEFKKEQLKVQISNHGMLKISGERPLDSSRKTKFHKEFSLFSGNYDTAAIHAKFIQGWLHITMPKGSKIPLKLSAETSKIDDQIPKQESNADQNKATPCPNDGIGGMSRECEFQGQKRSSGLRLAKVAATLAATAGVMAVFVAYIVYMYKSTVGEIDD